MRPRVRSCYSRAKATDTALMNRIKIRLGGYQGPNSVHTRGAVRFGEVLKREAGALVDFELVPDVLALGRPSGDLPLMVENGELALCYISTVRFARAVPELTIFELPYVVRDRARAIAALNGGLGNLLKAGMQARTPFRALGFWDNGFRHITNRVRPIRTPADCAGLRIRTQMSELHGETLGAFGFEPIPVDIKEFVEQIATERFEAQENPLTNTFNFNVHDYHRYFTLSGHFFGTSALICSKAQYAAWPDQLQRAVDVAGREATAHQHMLAAQEDEEVLAQLEGKDVEVIRLTAEEQDAFVKAVEPVLARHRKALDPKLFDCLS
jgi:TRAP-type C4-dicarboxylate transport system substrate-binding protein